MKRLTPLLVVLLIFGCQAFTPSATDDGGGQPAGEAPPATQPVAAVADTLVPTPAPTSVPEPDVPDLELVVTGPEEVVFDWTTDRCEDLNIPDIAVRAFRGADGMVQMVIGHFVNYRMIGPDLDHLESDCSAPVMVSDLDDDPAMFNDAEWLGSFYTEDGETIYAMVHNEYRGHRHGDTRPSQCPSGDYLTCLDTSLTMAISTDGGASYHDIRPAPDHLVATLPVTFNDQGVPSGVRSPSNIIQGPDGYFYVFSNISDYPDTPGDPEPHWVCLMRTNNLDDPSSWRFWDGSGFNGVFLDPYTDTIDPNAPFCAELDPLDLSGSLNDSITYNTVLQKYILIGISYHPTAPEPMYGVYYALSDDLIEWTTRKLLIEIPMIATVNPETDLHYAYPSLLDPNSESRNFDTTGETAYLYLTRANFGTQLDRDLVRIPVALAPVTYDIPSWGFDTDGDVEGWLPENQLEDFDAAAGVLTMQTTGQDPYMVSPPVEFPTGDYNQLSLTLKVSAGDATIGQVFFVTDANSEWSEDQSVVFDVIADGEFHTYDLDMSSASGWSGLAQQFRFDPVASAGRTVEIDSITITN